MENFDFLLSSKCFEALTALEKVREIILTLSYDDKKLPIMDERIKTILSSTEAALNTWLIRQ